MDSSCTKSHAVSNIPELHYNVVGVKNSNSKDIIPQPPKYPLRPLTIDLVTQPLKIHSATSQPYISD